MSAAGHPKVYLAGFDVFREDAVERGEYLKRLCRAQGLEGLYPFDNEVPEGLAAAERAAQIYQLNLAMIRAADAVLANLDPFRGFEPDSGTAFEVERQWPSASRCGRTSSPGAACASGCPAMKPAVMPKAISSRISACRVT